MKSRASGKVSLAGVQQERESERQRVDDRAWVDQRGDRTGLPSEVAQELTALRSYLAELHSRNRSAREMATQDD